MSSSHANRAPRMLAVGIAAAGVLALVSAPAAGANRPSLTASSHVAGLPAVVWGKAITLSGHETLGGKRSFVFEAQEFPFKSGFRRIATGNTTGSYSLAVRPSHATRYRVVIGNRTSRVLTVYVIERTLSTSCNLCRRRNTAGAHKLIFTSKVKAPPGALAVKGPVYFYYAQRNGSNAEPSTLHLVRVVPLHIHGQMLSFRVSYTVHFPARAFRFLFAACFKDAESKDGLGLPGDHHCGDATVSSVEVRELSGLV